MRQRLCACCRRRVEPRAESPRKHLAAECLEDHYTPKAGSLAFSVQNSPHSAVLQGKIDTWSPWCKHICVDSRYCSEAPSDYDFALLELDKPMPINECIGLACLPSGEDSPGQGCSITGWGTAATGPRPNILQEASVTTLQHELCARKYAEHNSSITSSMLCASGHSESGITDACHGDSGGPMVCEENGFFVVRGVTSWGLGCASRFPGVYARVSLALDWIHSTMASSHLASQVMKQDLKAATSILITMIP